MTLRRDPERLAASDAAADAELKRALEALSREKPPADELLRVRWRLEQAVSQAGKHADARPASMRLARAALAGAALLGALVVGPRLAQRFATPAAGSGDETAVRRPQPEASQPSSAAPPAAAVPAAAGVDQAGEPSPQNGRSRPDALAPEAAASPAATTPPARTKHTDAALPASHPGKPARAASAHSPAPRQPPATPIREAQPTAAEPARETQPAPAAQAAQTRAEVASAPAPADTARPSAPDEVSLLRQARQRASADPEAALRVLDEHKRRFARGTLGPEREVLAIELLRALSRKAEADARAEAFRRDYPGSVYLPRVLR